MSGIGITPSYPLETFRKKEGQLIDIRSPKEFKQGHWPGAINIPLFNNEERALIGTTYKKNGSEKAILLGLQLTLPKLPTLKEVLKQESQKNNAAQIKFYCWRGGLRSSSVAWFAKSLGLNPILLRGGYKTYRRWAINQFEKKWALNLLGGKTGTGKTSLLLELSKKGISTIDLEGLANHRGSSFGGLGLSEQPTSEHFENMIAEQLNVHENKPRKCIWLEAESANLGKCRIPHQFFKQMKNAPLLEITRDINERIKILVDEYSLHDQKELSEATLRISRRLGPQRTGKAIEAIKNKHWELACHEILDYYDKCYEYELQKVQKKQIVDISGLGHQSAAEKLIGLGYAY